MASSAGSSSKEPASGAEQADEADNTQEATKETEGEEAETEGRGDSDTSEGSSAKAGASSQQKPSRLTFMWDVLKEAVGMGSEDSTPTSQGSGVADYPWVEFPGEDGSVRYRNKVTGEVVLDMPKDFEKYGAATEVDTETLALTVVQQKQTRWERYRDMLSDTPLMRAIDDAARSVRESEVARSVESTREELQEQWETSQNPLVYRMTSAYDAVFAETEQARAVARIQELDPRFDGGAAFLDECRNVLIPRVVSALLRGDRVELDGWCTDECMARVNAVLRARESEGLTVDSTVLSTSQVSLAGAKLQEKDAPVVLVTGMVQQLHCLRNKEGEVVEGSEDEIRAVMYALGLQRLYIPEKGGLVWQVAELSYTGGQLYL